MGQECSCHCGDGKTEVPMQEYQNIMQNNTLMQEQLDLLEQQKQIQKNQGYQESMGVESVKQSFKESSINNVYPHEQRETNQGLPHFGQLDIDVKDPSMRHSLDQEHIMMAQQNIGRKTVAVLQQGNDFVHQSPQMRNSMRNYNQIQMKTFEQLLPKFSGESGLEYVDQFVFANNSVYRGQMKKVDEQTKQKLTIQQQLSDNTSSQSRGALQNRLSAKLEDQQMGSSSTPMDDKDQHVVMDKNKPGTSSSNLGSNSANGDQQFPSMIRHGYGVQYWNDGAHYEGMWQYNKAEGQGTFWHAEGDVYRGEFKNDMANGYGEYTHINGSKYKGEFKNDVQEGHGEEEWIDGAKYVGSYVDSMKHGYGVYKWSNNSVYKGNWEQNKISGYGEYTWNDGRIYKGYWKDNNMHGQGIYMWADGRKYEGEYLNDKKHGFGIYTYPDGRSYNGQWANGKQHGEGIFITPHGASRKGIWHEGKRTQWIDNEDQQQQHHAQQQQDQNMDQNQEQQNVQ